MIQPGDSLRNPHIRLNNLKCIRSSSNEHTHISSNQTLSPFPKRLNQTFHGLSICLAASNYIFPHFFYCKHQFCHLLIARFIFLISKNWHLKWSLHNSNKTNINGHYKSNDWYVNRMSFLAWLLPKRHEIYVNQYLNYALFE